jgi:hypothetical protein
VEEMEFKRIDQEMTLFAVTWTTDVNELKRNYTNDILHQTNHQSTEHFGAVISSLLAVSHPSTLLHFTSLPYLSVFKDSQTHFKK